MDNSFYYPLPSCKIFLSKNDFIKLHNLTLKKTHHSTSYFKLMMGKKIELTLSSYKKKMSSLLYP